MYLCILVLVSFWIHLSLSTSGCESPCNISFTTCVFVNYPVYTVGLNVTANEIQAADILNIVETYKANIISDCREAISNYTCGVLYPQCKEDSNGQGGVQLTVQRPCRRMCERVRTACALYTTFLSPAQQAFFNCDQLNDDGSPKFSTNEADCYVLDNEVDRCVDRNHTAPSVLVRSGCQLYDPSLSPLTHTSCAPFVNSEIFVPNALDPKVQTLLDTIANASGAYLVDTVRMVIPIGCYKRLMSLLCQTTYPTCTRVFDSITGRVVEAGAPPCYENCLGALDECESLLLLATDNPAGLVNCSAINPITATRIWPEGPTFLSPLPDQNATVSVQCSTLVFPPNTSSQFVMRDVEQCPYFLVKSSRPTDSDRLCWIPCPDPSYSEEMWDDLVVFSLVIASISIVLMSFLLLSYMLIFQYRHRRMHMCIFISSGLMSLAILIGGRTPQKDVWCANPTTYANTGNNPVCEIQGFVFQFGALSVSTWWLIIAFHMFRRIVLGLRSNLKKVLKYYYLFGWGVPLAYTVATSAVKGHGYGPPLPFCSLQTPPSQHAILKNVSIDFVVFVIPLGFCLTAATCLMVAVAYKVWSILRESTSIREQTKSDLAVQRRLFFFVLLLLGILVILFSWRFILQSSGPKILQQDQQYVICKMKNDMGLQMDDKCSDDVLPVRFSYNFTMFESFICAGMGVFVFMALGSDKALFRFWYKLLLLQPTQMVHLVREGTASIFPTTEMSLRRSTSASATASRTQITEEPKEEKDEKTTGEEV